jgi:integrase
MRREYSEAYTAKMIIKCRTFCRDAADRKVEDANVFAKVQAGSQVNVARHRFVDRATIDKVIAGCPDPQWKLLIALSRYAGLRCPSEHLALTWDDVDCEGGQMTVRACKTEHHAVGGIRIVPIFEDLHPYLRAVYEAREEGVAHVITRYRQASCNLRTQFIRYIRQAGPTPWPRLFHNLRASCQTELAERFPSHVVCQWIGHSELVARKHYLQTTDEHFGKANGTAGAAAEAGPTTDAKTDAAPAGTGPQDLAPIDL